MARIAIGCECGRRLTVRAERAGGRTRCPGCGNLLEIPQAGASPSEPTATAAAPTVMAQGRTCAVCQTLVEAEEPAVGCPGCATPYHAECWQEYGGCATYGCQHAPKQEKTSEPTKECPFCAETIPAKVLRCPSCRERFEDARPVDREEYIQGLINAPEHRKLRNRCLTFLALSILPCLGPVTLPVGVVWLKNNRAEFEQAGPVFLVMVCVATAMGATHSLLIALDLLAVAL